MKKLKKIISVFVVTLSVLSFSMIASAADACLDVRDYGDHRYQERVYEPYEANHTCMGMDQYGRLVIYYDLYQRCQCICGAETVKYLGKHVKYVKP